MVYTKIKLKNHRKNSVQISIANLKISLKKQTCILWAAINFGPDFEILSFKTEIMVKKNHIMGKILDVLVYNLIQTVFSKSNQFGRQSVLKKHLNSVV